MKEKETYEALYGDIPKSKMERLDYLLGQVRSAKSVKGKLISRMLQINAIPWKSISYTIYMVPKATPRPRASQWNHFYVRGASDNKKFFKEFYKKNLETEMITTPCEFYCRSYLPIPKSMHIAEQILAELGFIRPISKPDFDNLAKTYTDMTQGVLLYDDALVVKGVSEKFYSIKPRIEICFRYMTEFDSVYNKKKVEKPTVEKRKEKK